MNTKYDKLLGRMREAEDLSGYVTKPSFALTGNLAMFDENDNLVDSGLPSALAYNADATTWAALIYRRDHGSLVSGMWYRITDYECILGKNCPQLSAAHPFDIVVRADDPSHLSEDAYAMRNINDQYFGGCHLEAWKLKYCIDNDTTRFAWADDSKGKGVVYYMKDEWGNEAPYDFKNILFNRLLDEHGYFNPTQGNNQMVYTFNAFDGTTIHDASVVQSANIDSKCTGNVIGEYFSLFGHRQRMELPDVVFCNAYANDATFHVSGNSTGHGSHACTFGNSCSFNRLGTGCSNVDLLNLCTYNSFGNGCNDIGLGHGCSSNTVGDGVKLCAIPDLVSFCIILNGIYGEKGSREAIPFQPGITIPQYAAIDDTSQIQVFIPGNLMVIE